MPEETCVLCNAKLDSKKSLQEHFRKHANKEIDNRGLPIPKVTEVHDGHQTSGSQASGRVDRSVGLTGNKSAINSIKTPKLQSLAKKHKKVEVQTYDSSNKSHQSQVNGSVSTPSTQLKLGFISCDVCRAAFQSVGLAIKHKRLSHPEQPSNFCCAHCGKQFPLKTFLENHTKSEHAAAMSEPEGVFNCQECNHVFYNEEAKNYHEKKAHKRVESVLRPVATPPPSKKIRVTNAGVMESVYYCHLCGAEYILKYNLRQHLEIQHSKEETNFGPDTEIIRCTTCDAIFCNLKAYEVHNMYHQPNDLYVSSEEHRLRTVSRVDQDFDVRRVQVQIPKSIRGYAKQMKSKIVWNSQCSRLSSSIKQFTLPPIQSKLEETTKSTDSEESVSKCKSKLKVSKAIEPQESTAECKSKPKPVQACSFKHNKSQVNAGSNLDSADTSKSLERSSRSQAGRLRKVCLSSDCVDSGASPDKHCSSNSIASRVKRRGQRSSLNRNVTLQC